MAGDLRRLRGDRDKKSVPHCIVHAGMNGLSSPTTDKLQKLMLDRHSPGIRLQNYISPSAYTSLLRHFYITP